MKQTDQTAGENVLQVNMLGGFAMLWNGENIACGPKTDDSQFARIMQIVLHNREKGVSRTELQEMLFSDSKAEDVHHLLRTDLYNVRKRLRAAGLPQSNYIVYRKGRYYWTEDIQVTEDAVIFEENAARAAAETEEDRKCELMLEACYSYKGEFLPLQTGLMWVAQEEKRYRDMFLDCVRQAAELLRKSNRYLDLEAVGRHAVAVCPLRDLELYIIEPLVSMGRLKEAYELYDFTIDHYQKEIGMSCTQPLMTRMEQVISGANRPASLIDDIKAQLEDGSAAGGYLCSYPAFQSIYRMLQRTLIRSEKSGFLMICTARGLTDIGRFNEKSLRDFSETLKNTILESVRKSDIVCRYGRGQYLLILLSNSEENCRIVGERIRTNLRRSNPRYSIEYHVRPMKLVKEEE